jgi:hypothetical protein
MAIPRGDLSAYGSLKARVEAALNQSKESQDIEFKEYDTYDAAVEISVSLENAEGVYLTLDDPNRIGFSNYRANEESIQHIVTLEREALIASGRQHAVEAAKSFFESFGWQDVNIEMIQQDQRRLLERRYI